MTQVQNGLVLKAHVSKSPVFSLARREFEQVARHNFKLTVVHEASALRESLIVRGMMKRVRSFGQLELEYIAA